MWEKSGAKGTYLVISLTEFRREGVASWRRGALWREVRDDAWTFIVRAARVVACREIDARRRRPREHRSLRAGARRRELRFGTRRAIGAQMRRVACDGGWHRSAAIPMTTVRCETAEAKPQWEDVADRGCRKRDGLHLRRGTRPEAVPGMRRRRRRIHRQVSQE